MDERKEMPHWIFVISNSDSEFEKRMKKKEWPIFSFTANRKKLESDDSVVFYKAGIGVSRQSRGCLKNKKRRRKD